MAYVLIVVLGSFVLHRAPFRSTTFVRSHGLVNTGVYAGEINADATPLGLISFVRSVLAYGSTGVPDARTVKDKRPLPGWKVRSACRSTLRVLFYVHTAPYRAHMRRLLRETVGEPGIVQFLNSSLVFFVGQVADEELRSTLQAEVDAEGDVVQLGFLDTYRNLTHKFIHATKWLGVNGCLNSTEVVVKIDDDVMVNVFHLKNYISTFLAVGSPSFRSIHCCVKYSMPVERSRWSKWYVTKEEYADDRYPDYCAGVFVIMRAPVLAFLCEAIECVPYFWIDDIYATGLLRRAKNVSLVSIEDHCYVQPSIYTMVLKKAFFLHLGTQPALFTRAKQLWRSVMRQKPSAKR